MSEQMEPDTRTGDDVEEAAGHVCGLSPLQVEYLLRALDPRRVKLDPGNFKYVEQNDCRVWLNRIFGVGGWSLTTLELKEVTTRVGGTEERPRFWVTYRAQVRLRIKGACGHWLTHIDDGSAGGAENQPRHKEAHDLAMKDALSSALKRCCVSLGDQFGLGLYFDDIKPGQAVVQTMIPYVDTDKAENHARRMLEDRTEPGRLAA